VDSVIFAAPALLYSTSDLIVGGLMKNSSSRSTGSIGRETCLEMRGPHTTSFPDRGAQASSNEASPRSGNGIWRHEALSRGFEPKTKPSPTTEKDCIEPFIRIQADIVVNGIAVPRGSCRPCSL
jgi:hypothetical protein